jgi:hypothetical protein
LTELLEFGSPFLPGVEVPAEFEATLAFLLRFFDVLNMEFRSKCCRLKLVSSLALSSLEICSPFTPPVELLFRSADLGCSFETFEEL